MFCVSDVSKRSLYPVVVISRGLRMMQLFYGRYHPHFVVFVLIDGFVALVRVCLKVRTPIRCAFGEGQGRMQHTLERIYRRGCTCVVCNKLSKLCVDVKEERPHGGALRQILGVQTSALLHP